MAGTLDLGGGVFNLGDGDDNFVVHDGTQVLGTIDGGAGLDSRTYDINTIANLGALANFEGLTKTGTGTLNINGPGDDRSARSRSVGRHAERRPRAPAWWRRRAAR